MVRETRNHGPDGRERGLVSPTGLATGNSLNGLRRSAGTMDFPCRCRPIIHTRTNPWCVACRAFYPIFPNRKKCPSRSLRFASAKEQEKPGESFAHQYRWGYYQYSGVLHSVPVLSGAMQCCGIATFPLMLCDFFASIVSYPNKTGTL